MNNNLEFKLAKVARELAFEILTNDIFTKTVNEIDDDVEKAIRDKMLTLTKLNTKVGDIENKAFAINDKEIVFPPYGADQLTDILNDRAELAFNENVVESDVILHTDVVDHIPPKTKGNHQ